MAQAHRCGRLQAWVDGQSATCSFKIPADSTATISISQRFYIRRQRPQITEAMDLAKILNSPDSAMVRGGLVRPDPPSSYPTAEPLKQNCNPEIHCQPLTELAENTIKMGQQATPEEGPVCAILLPRALVEVRDPRRLAVEEDLSSTTHAPSRFSGSATPPADGLLVFDSPPYSPSTSLEDLDSDYDPEDIENHPWFTNPWLPTARQGPQEHPREICPLDTGKTGRTSSPRRGSRFDGKAPPVPSTEPSPCVPSDQVPLDAITSHTHDLGSNVVAERSERRQPELSARKRHFNSQEADRTLTEVRRGKRAKLDQLVSEGERKANRGSLHGPPSVSAEGRVAPFRRGSSRVPPAPRGSPRASIVPQSLAQAPTPAPYLPHHRDSPLIGKLRENLHSLLAQAA